MPRLIYDSSAFRTGRRLGDYLGIDRSSEYEDSWDRTDVLIRYGNRQRVPYRPSIRTINRRRMLNRQSERLDQLRRLESAGVPVPEFARRADSIPGRVLGRSNGGMMGRGIEVYEGEIPSDADHDFYQRLITKERQFRVHVIGGETRTRELIPNEEENREQAVWNYGNGFTFRVPDDIPHPVVPMAFAAVKALWLEFGAVDVIYNGNTYVLEVNTAPGLSDNSLEWYAEQLAKQYLYPEQYVDMDEVPGWDEAERRSEE